MNAEDLLCNDGRDRKAVKRINECLPDLDVAPSLAFVVEAVDTSDVRAFVVAAEEEEVLGELQLVAHKQENRLQALLAAIDVIAEEEVVGLRREAAILEKSQQIIVLAVNISADLRCSLSAPFRTC